jgi:hypothetical protein
MSTVHCPPYLAYYRRFPIPGAIGAFTGLFVCVALVFAWRRLSGALVIPLSPALLIASGLLMGAMALGIRTLQQRASHGGPVLDLLLGGSLLIFAAALTLPGADTVTLSFFWLFLLAEEIWIWQSRAVRLIRRLSGKKAPFRPIRVDVAQSLLPHLEPIQTIPAADAEPLSTPAWPAKDVTQQLVRSVAADGSELISGWLRLNFAPGQRTGNIHIAFCPPFARTPELSVAQLNGPQSRIKIAQLLPYGARLELKLVAFSPESTAVLLQFSARATAEPAA